VSISSTFCKQLLPEDRKRAKKTDNLTVFFALSGSALVKAAHRTLMKLTPGTYPTTEEVTKANQKASEPQSLLL